jgi:hypothetical protein
MPYAIDGPAGVNLDQAPNLSLAPFKGLPLGTVVRGDDGRMYINARASAAVAANTAVVLTEPAMTFAGGAGQWLTQGTAVPINAYVWLRSAAI